MINYLIKILKYKRKKYNKTVVNSSNDIIVVAISFFGGDRL